jgi:hypothetical protein
VHYPLNFSKNSGVQERATRQKHRETQAQNEPTHKASVLIFYFSVLADEANCAAVEKDQRGIQQTNCEQGTANRQNATLSADQ